MAFETLAVEPPDPLLSVIGLFNADPRPDKVDLGVGVFRTEEGVTPVMRAVKAAETLLLQSQQTKAYVGQSGDLDYVELVRDMVFGPQASGRHVRGLQTTGGTGALRIGADLLARAKVRTVHVGRPSWANHLPILSAARVPFTEHEHFDAFAQRVSFDAVAGALEAAQRGDVVLLQAACHNPTGADLDLEQWRVVADIVGRRGLVPFIDVAYQGLGEGLEADVAGARLVLAAATEALVATSCSKSFGLYRERTGALFAVSDDAERAATMHSNLLAIARTAYSMPPDHGAAIVRTILQDDGLRRDWETELAAMRERINGLRARLAAIGQVGGIDFSGLARQRGMFSVLPLSPQQIARMRDEFAVHMVASGRINLAGLRSTQVEPFLDALRKVAG